MDLGRVGIWTFSLDLQPAARARTLATELEELGYGAIWIPDAVGRDPLVHAALPYNVPPEHTARAREILGPEKLLAPEQAVLLETDPTEARRIGRSHVAIYRDLPNYMNNLRRFGITDDDIADGGSDRLVDTLVAWGDVDAIRARVQAHLDAGADHVAVQVLTPERSAVPLDQWRELAPALL